MVLIPFGQGMGSGRVAAALDRLRARLNPFRSGHGVGPTPDDIRAIRARVLIPFGQGMGSGQVSQPVIKE